MGLWASAPSFTAQHACLAAQAEQPALIMCTLYAPAAPVSRAPPGSGMVNGALLRAVDSWTHHPAYSPEGIYETADWAS